MCIDSPPRSPHPEAPLWLRRASVMLAALLWVVCALASHSAQAQSYLFEARLPSTATADRMDEARGAALLPDGCR